MKIPIVTKIVQKAKFEGDCAELGAKGCFRGQSWSGCVWRALVFVWDSAVREGFNFYFSGNFGFRGGGGGGAGAGAGI